MKKVALVFGLAIFICFIVLAGVASLFVVAELRVQSVNGSSMNDFLVDGDTIVTIKKSPARFDVVVYENNSTALIKRVIGLPADKVSIVNNELLINSELPYTGSEIDNIASTTSIYVDSTSVLDSTFELQSGEYLLIGDNQNQSLDSRHHGLVKGDEIKGVMILKL